MNRDTRVRAILYALFTLSGFAGLIYESIWSHYLKLFLGHAAYAQTLVLVIFMGGMALGSWIAGRWTLRFESPLQVYALVEGALGLGALAFDPLFRGMQAWMFDTVIPSLGSPLLIDIVKWSASGLIVLPQSILLGATFPLMSAGVIRILPQTSGRALSWLYFTNSLGASVGVLVSGFYLIARSGLPGTIVCAGIINFVLALSVLMVSRATEEHPPEQATPSATGDASARSFARMMIAVAFLTGAASFFYEIGWIRMLSLVLGSATHSFELMLSAFILGIALGSFFIRTRIEDSERPLRMLGWIQVAMATAAFLSIPIYNRSFDWMAFMIQGLQRSDAGYAFFNVLSHGICVALMLPVTFFAGMTLPLITAILLRNGHGESSIGRVYSANTLGSIVGVLLAVHVAMPYFGLRQVVICGAFIDLGLGLWLLARAVGAPSSFARVGIAASLLVAGFVTLFVHFNVANLASGVFRWGLAQREGTVLYHRDGRVATVDVVRAPSGQITIATNGKVDAGIMPGKVPSLDEFTMAGAALLPMMFKPDATHAAVIGMGSGRTTDTLLANSRLQEVDTIEIEPAMSEGARQFDENRLTTRVFSDPRSKIHIEDAKTYFARNGRLYDYIIAEPSNPWVSGVSSLFSAEFYRQVKRYLKPGGVFVQWIQLYEINVPLVGTVARALDTQFDDYVVYAPSDKDILVVAAPHGQLTSPSDWVFGDATLSSILRFIDLHNIDDVQNRRLGGKRTLAPFFEAMPVPLNSDYFPVLDQFAVKQRFLHADAMAVLDLHSVGQRLDGPGAIDPELTPSQPFIEGTNARQAQLIAAYFSGRTSLDSVAAEPTTKEDLALIARVADFDERCDEPLLRDVWLPSFREFAYRYLPYLTPRATAEVVNRIKSRKCYGQAPQAIRDWVAFVEAIGAQNWKTARELGEAIVATHPKDQADIDFIARELLMTDLRAGDAGAAKTHLQLFGPDTYRTVPAQYLRALALTAR